VEELRGVVGARGVGAHLVLEGAVLFDLFYLEQLLLLGADAGGSSYAVLRHAGRGG
jgi:hypothetical protein